jgi:uncharacterized membrane protein YdjX (TVP38/TMEM64 family)
VDSGIHQDNSLQAQNPSGQEEPPTGGKSGGWWRPVALLAVVIAVLVLAKVFGIGGRLAALRDWIGALNPLGPLVFVLIYVVAVIAALPGSALTIAAGALFGSVEGIILVSISATIGASLAFLIGRYFAREAVVRWLSKSEKFQRLDQLTEEHGAIIVALTRLVPIFPFNLLNYGFGLTRVPFWTYVSWSWLCMLPGTALYVVGADAFTKGLAQGKVPWGLLAALAGVLVILTLLVRSARKKLQLKEMKTQAGSPPDAGKPYREPEISPLDQYNETLLANVRPPG